MVNRLPGFSGTLRILAVAIVAMVGSASSAQEARRSAEVRWARGVPFVSFGASDLATAKVRRELTGGLRKRFVMMVESRLEGSGARIASRTFECAATYDLWDEGYLIRIGQITERVATLDAVIKRCLVVGGLGVGLPKEYVRHRGKRLYFSVRAEFNPISKRQCRDLVRSGGRGGDAIGPIAVNIVRRRVCAAEATLEFRSQSSVVPAQ